MKAPSGIALASAAPIAATPRSDTVKATTGNDSFQDILTGFAPDEHLPATGGDTAAPLPAAIALAALSGLPAPAARAGLPFADATADAAPSPGRDTAGPSPGGVDTADGEASDTAVPGRVKVSILLRETHFAPVRDLDRGVQIRDETAGDEPFVREGLPPSQNDDVVPAGPSGTDTSVATTRTGTGGTAPPTMLPFTSLVQIGRAIAAETARATSGLPAMSEAAAGGPVRVLEMALTPETLGRVVIRMRLSGTGLDVRIRASEPTTQRLLEQDREQLMQLIRSQGMTVETLDIANTTFAVPPRAGWSAPAAPSPDTPPRRDPDRDGHPSGQEPADEEPSSRARARADAADD